jgi:signal peptidase II
VNSQIDTDSPPEPPETPEAPEAPGHGGGAARLAMYRDGVVISAVALVVLFDQLTKFIIRANLSLGESVPSQGFVRFTYYENSGTIFGLFPSATVILTVVSFLAIGFLIYFFRTQRSPGLVMRIAIGILLGGAVGNLIDRLFKGEVTDFVDVGRWPIFNIADASITVGIFLLVVVSSFAPDKDKPESESGAESDGPLVGEPSDRLS